MAAGQSLPKKHTETLYHRLVQFELSMLRKKEKNKLYDRLRLRQALSTETA